MDLFIRFLVFILGIYLVIVALTAAVRTFVVPRSENVFLTRLFNWPNHHKENV